MPKQVLEENQENGLPKESSREIEGAEVSKQSQSATLSNGDFTTGWICALEIEDIGAQEMLDEEFDDFVPRQDPSDWNTYKCGRIGEHMLVIARLPEYGTDRAAQCATHMCHTFPYIRIALMVGTGGGIPSKAHDIRLGDVVVSKPLGQHPGVIQYDRGKQYDDGFSRTGCLNKPPACLITAVNSLATDHRRGKGKLMEILCHMVRKNESTQRNFPQPDPETDKLYSDNFSHVGPPGSDCSRCDKSPDQSVVERKDVRSDPLIHYGTIASGNLVVRDISIRKRIRQKLNALCFETEAAGLMNDFPCLVIRGISDYSDSHKNDSWQPYAAATAAAYAKELLLKMRSLNVVREPMAKDLLKKVDKVYDAAVVTNAGVQNLIETRNAEEDERMRKKIIRRLTPIDFRDKRNGILSRRVEGTGMWLFESAHFQDWMQSKNGTLYCQGIPGAGKTMLASIVADYLITEYSDENFIVLSSYYDYKDNANQCTDKMVAALLRQAIEMSQTVNEAIKKLHELLVNGSKILIKFLFGVLVSILKGFPRIFIVLDALDECSDLRSRKHYLHWLEALRKECTDVRLFLTSRPDPLVDKLIHGKRLPFRAAENDINLVIEDQISALSECIPCPKGLWDIAKRKITESADGVFLLAYLHVQSLKGATNPEEVEKALDNLSDSIPEAYETAIARINSQSPQRQELARRLIAWAIFSVRPLDSVELQHALAIESGKKTLDRKRIRTIEMILSVSVGLITRDVKSDVIRPVHETAQKFLENKADFWGENPQIYLAKTCLAFFSPCYLDIQIDGTESSEMERINNPGRDTKSGSTEGSSTNESAGNQCALHQFESEVWATKVRVPCQFLDYAVLFWWEHVQHVQAECMDEVLPILMNREMTGFCYGILQNSRYNTIPYEKLPVSGATGLHVVASCGLEKVCERLVDSGVALDAVDAVGRTALYVAARHGFSSMIKQLCSPTTVQKANWKSNYTPLLVAAEGGHADIVKKLLDYGANVKHRNSKGRSALHIASRNRYSEIVDRLLQSDANVNAQDYFGSTALHIASWNGYCEIVDRLLQSDINVNAQDRDGDTALNIATRNGYNEILDRLVQFDANVNIQNRRGDNAIHTAFWCGSVRIVECLLRSGVDGNARNSSGDTALHVASDHRYGKIVEYLLRCGADVNARTAGGHTALFWASLHGYSEIVDSLLRFGADIDAGGPTGTPLAVASEQGHCRIVEKLLFHKANVNARDDHNATPLHRACTCSWGNTNVVKLLAQSGADVNAVNNSGKTPLDIAHTWDNINIVRALQIY